MGGEPSLPGLQHHVQVVCSTKIVVEKESLLASSVTTEPANATFSKPKTQSDARVQPPADPSLLTPVSVAPITYAPVSQSTSLQLPALTSSLPSRRVGCRGVHDFEVIAKIGEGTYGTVSRARDPQTGELVAIKKIKFIEQWNYFPMTTLREIRSLRRLRHPNVIELKEVLTSPASSAPPTSQPGATLQQHEDVFMVFPYAENDLAGMGRPKLRDCLLLLYPTVNVFRVHEHVTLLSPTLVA